MAQEPNQMSGDAAAALPTAGHAPTPGEIRVQIEQTRAMLPAAAAADAARTTSTQTSMMMAGGSTAAAKTAPIDATAVAVAAMLGSPQFQKR